MKPEFIVKLFGIKEVQKRDNWEYLFLEFRNDHIFLQREVWIDTQWLT